MKKLLVLAVVALSGIAAGSGFAAQPANPGCFGKARADYANQYGSLGSQPGGVGYYASLRAGDNGAQNQQYKDGCGGSPA